MAVDKQKLPVFLVGCQRSGTTLVRYILDSHPHIACPPESKFIAGLYQLINYPQLMTGLLGLKWERDDIIMELGNFARKILDAYAEKRKKLRWVDKTPNYYRLLPFIYDMFAGNVLFIFIVRHPLDTIISLDEYFGYISAFHEIKEASEICERYGAGLQSWAQYWKDVNESIRIFSTVHVDRSHLIRYEDLVKNPTAVTTEMLAFMGEQFHPDIIRKAFRIPHDRGYQDFRIFRTRRIHDKSIGRWRTWNTDQISTIWQIVAGIAEYYKYGTDTRTTRFHDH